MLLFSPFVLLLCWLSHSVLLLRCYPIMFYNCVDYLILFYNCVDYSILFCFYVEYPILFFYYVDIPILFCYCIDYQYRILFCYLAVSKRNLRLKTRNSRRSWMGRETRPRQPHRKLGKWSGSVFSLAFSEKTRGIVIASLSCLPPSSCAKTLTFAIKIKLLLPTTLKLHM